MHKFSLSWVLLLVVLPIHAESNHIPKLGSDPNFFNLKACIKDSTKDCREAVCIANTPSNCRAQCSKNASNKCHSLAGQQLLRMNKTAIHF